MCESRNVHATKTIAAERMQWAVFSNRCHCSFWILYAWNITSARFHTFSHPRLRSRYSEEATHQFNFNERHQHSHTQKLRTFGKSGFVIFMQKLLLCRQWHAVPNFSTENRLVWWQKKSEKLSGLCSRQHPLFIVCECDSWLAAYRSRQAFVWS